MIQIEKASVMELSVLEELVTQKQYGKWLNIKANIPRHHIIFVSALHQSVECTEQLNQWELLKVDHKKSQERVLLS